MTAADSRQSNDTTETVLVSTPDKIAAVNNKKNKNVIENYIDKELTPAQEVYLQRLLPILSSYFPDLSSAQLAEGIRHTLCDSQAFSRAGKDFFKKLNTLQKAIRAGRWQVPAAIEARKKQENNNTQIGLQKQWRELHGEYQQLHDMALVLKQQRKHRLHDKIQQQMQECHDRMRLVENALQEFGVSS